MRLCSYQSECAIHACPVEQAEEMLDLSRMETGDLSFKFDDHSLIECCQNALDSISHRVPEGVKLTFSPDTVPVILHTIDPTYGNGARFIFSHPYETPS